MIKPVAIPLFITSILALLTCPHSKVEESFNLQATHDLFYHGVEPAWQLYNHKSLYQACAAGAGEEGTCINDDISLPYDHLQFPGVVPRTFFGAFILSYTAKLIALIIPNQILDMASCPLIVQFLIRLELLLLNWLACIRLAGAVDSHFTRNSKQAPQMNATAGSYYLIITAAQFHIPFYSSRLLPNTFALLFITNAYADWFLGHYRQTAMYLVFTTAIFRCDMLVLLFTVGLCMLIRRQLSITEALGVGVVTGIASLILTVPLDSLLWRRPIWPEFEVWWFNAVDNRSNEWGEMVWHWYFSRALPKSLMATAILVPLAFVRLPELVDERVRKKNNEKQEQRQRLFFDWSLFPFFAPVFAYVVLYSFLPHKEVRFIFPALPMFNVCAAYGMSRLHHVAFSRSKLQARSSWDVKLMFICGMGSIFLTSLASLVFLRMSIENYPGGDALMRLRSHLLDTIPIQKNNKSDWNDVRVHVDVAAAMTGVSLFGQRHASIRQVGEGDTYEGPFKIDKSGYEEENNLKDEAHLNSFTHLLTERTPVDGYHLIDVAKGYPRLDIRNYRVATQNAIFVYERDGWRQ